MTVDLNTLDVLLLMLAGYATFSGLIFSLRLLYGFLFNLAESRLKRYYSSRLPLLPSSCCSRCSRYTSCATSTDCVFIPCSDYNDALSRFRVH